MLVFAIILRIWSTRKCSSHKKIFVDLDITLEIVQEYHEDAEKIQELNALLFRNQIISEEETRIQFNKKFHSLELETHNGSQEETILCLKTNLFTSIYETVHEDNNPGFLRKYLPRIEKLKKKVENFWILTKIIKICRVYVDLFKDSVLTASIIFIMGGTASLALFPMKMTSVVVFCLMASIIFPMFLGSIGLAISRIQNSEKDLMLYQKVWIVMKTVVLCVIQPILITNEIENLKKETILVINDDKKLLGMLERISYLEKNESHLLKTELQLETVPQMAIQFLLIFMSSTNSPTTGGLEAMF